MNALSYCQWINLDQARGLVRFCKSAETYIYVQKNLLLFQLKKTLLSQLLVLIYITDVEIKRSKFIKIVYIYRVKDFICYKNLHNLILLLLTTLNVAMKTL